MTHRLPALGFAALLTVASLSALDAGQAPKPAGGLGQGVQVHGRWEIDVRQPDGALVSHHEFDNALITVGAQVAGNSVLAGLLGRQFLTVGDWVVLLDGAQSPCGAAAAGRVTCRIAEPTFPGGGFTGVFTNLMLTVPTRTETFPAVGSRQIPSGTLELAGTATAGLAGAIDSVSTNLGMCTPGANCFVQGRFSSHVLPMPIAVAAGQIIQVRVVFSFS